MTKLNYSKNRSRGVVVHDVSDISFVEPYKPRIYLKVPYAEKDEAKKLGARFDGAKKMWYVLAVDFPPRFNKWKIV